MTALLFAGQHYEDDRGPTPSVTKRYYAEGKLLATRSIPNANPNAQTLRYVQADHLGSTSTLTDASGNVVARERYSAFGERRRGEMPLTTDQLYTGQQYNSLSGLYHYTDGKSAGRFYDPLLARFVMADSVTPGQGSQALNRYAYNLGNPIRYTDPSGHWSEEQLASTLGENWRDSYFGEGKVFEGRDNLLKFLTSENTTSDVVLRTMQPLMAATAGLQLAGLPMNEVDAVGARAVYTYGAAAFGGVSVDVLLNATAGQLSVFLSPEVGFILGDSLSLTGGVTLIKNLPSNDAFRGTFMAGGLVGGDLVGMNAEVFWSSPMADSYNPFDQAHGGFLGGGGAIPSIGGYGAISYAWELWREDAQGSHRIPYGFSLSNEGRL
ncbi:MAG: RHS repeat-associated core domain-containing protein [Anaerolineae bacterium]